MTKRDIKEIIFIFFILIIFIFYMAYLKEVPYRRCDIIYIKTDEYFKEYNDVKIIGENTLQMTYIIEFTNGDIMTIKSCNVTNDKEYAEFFNKMYKEVYANELQ
jgi:hypothetical protein